jgi:hypothetical protein
MRLGFVLTFPAVLAITQVGTGSFCLVALASLCFLAGGLIRAMFISFLFLVHVCEIEVGLIFVSVERLTLVRIFCPFAPTGLVGVPAVR